MKTYQIALPDEVAAFVDRVLAEKKWDAVEDLVTYALGYVEAELEADSDVDIGALRKAVQIGIDQADRGECVELDMEAVLAKARARLEAARDSRKQSA